MVLGTFLFLLTSCSSKPSISCPDGYTPDGKSCIPPIQCGDFICSLGEECDLDCPTAVQVLCSGTNCEEQQLLFADYAKLQTDVISCLEDYFDFKLPSATYTLQASSPISTCTDPQGCCCREGGLTASASVRQTSLNGYVEEGAAFPQKTQHLLADEHETTHVFLNAMLHVHPSWFSEAVAIQTNERVGCDTQSMTPDTAVYNYSLRGDAYLHETLTDQKSKGGILIQGKPLNSAWYQLLKERRITLESQDTHVLGALWIIGLREDYSCEKECVAQIVTRLHQQEKLRCKVGDCDTFTDNGITTADILKATSDTIGEDATSLFLLLGLI